MDRSGGARSLQLALVIVVVVEAYSSSSCRWQLKKGAPHASFGIRSSSASLSIFGNSRDSQSAAIWSRRGESQQYRNADSSPKKMSGICRLGVGSHRRMAHICIFSWSLDYAMIHLSSIYNTPEGAYTIEGVYTIPQRVRVRTTGCHLGVT